MKQLSVLLPAGFCYNGAASKGNGRLAGRNTLKNKKKKAICIAAAAVVLAALILGLGPDLWIVAAAGDSIVSPEEAAGFGADCILVLGAGLLPDGSPSLMLAERIQQGVDLYEAGAAPKLLMSGDHTRPAHDEVNAMKDAALARGVPSEDVFMDHAGIATYDSFYRARDIFSVKKLIIVTQAYHLPRALWIARRMGLEAVGVACDTRRYAGQLNRDVREILARDKDFFKCILLPPPRYLGEAIPIWGSGDATNDEHTYSAKWRAGPPAAAPAGLRRNVLSEL